MKRALSSAVLGGVLGAVSFASDSSAAEPSIVAVFEIQDFTGRVSEGDLRQLTDYLSASIARTSAFDVVPSSELRAALERQKAESYQACFDEACQIEIGKEVAAQKSIVTRILQVGSRCAVASTLLDVAKATSERAAAVKSDCDPDAIVAAIDQVVRELSGERAAVNASASALSGGGDAARGRLAVTSEPPGAEVRMDGAVVGHTPVILEDVSAIPHELVLSLDGYLPLTTVAAIWSGEEARVEARLADRPRYEEDRVSWERAGTWSAILGSAAVASAVGSAALLLLAPSERSIRTGAYEEYLSSGFPVDAARYAEVESRVSTHNVMWLGGWALAGVAAVAGGVFAVVAGGREEPEGSTARIATAPLRSTR